MITKVSNSGRLNSIYRKDDGKLDLFESKIISAHKMLNAAKMKLGRCRRRIPNIDTCFYLSESDLWLYKGY